MNVFHGNGVWDYVCIECDRERFAGMEISNLCGIKKKSLVILSYTFSKRKLGKNITQLRNQSKGQ